MNKLTKIVDFLEHNQHFNKMFRYNSMSHDIEFTREVNMLGFLHNNKLSDINLIDLKYYISKITDTEYNKQIIEEALIIVSRRYAYHPLKNYLNSLKWDSKSRLDTWLIDYLGTEDNDYTRAVGRKMLCGAVARAYNPGCKFDHMVILEGIQGIGKSTLLEVLCGEWYIDTDFSSAEQRKDLIDTLSSGWIVEIGDMSGFNKADIKNVRAFITRKVDKIRLPYGKRVLAFPKQCILVGTHNPSGDNEYLRDDSGNRRFWPVECTKADYIKIKQDRDQLFAEAIIKWKEGEKLYLDINDDNQAIEILRRIHAARESTNPLKKQIESYVKFKNEVTSTEIISEGFKIDISRVSANSIKGKQTLIGIWMRKNKWEKRGDTYYKTEQSLGQEEIKNWDEYA